MGLSKNSKTLGVWFHDGRELLEEGKFEEALECFDNALHINPNDPECLEEKGRALDKLGRHQEAIKCYHKARRMAMHRINDSYNLGLSCNYCNEVIYGRSRPKYPTDIQRNASIFCGYRLELLKSDHFFQICPPIVLRKEDSKIVKYCKYCGEEVKKFKEEDLAKTVKDESDKIVKKNRDKIIQDHKNGMSLEEIQKKYGISISKAYLAIYGVKKGKNEEDTYRVKENKKVEEDSYRIEHSEKCPFITELRRKKHGTSKALVATGIGALAFLTVGVGWFVFSVEAAKARAKDLEFTLNSARFNNFRSDFKNFCSDIKEAEMDRDKIIQEYKNGMSLEEIQKKYGISISKAYRVIHYGEDLTKIDVFRPKNEIAKRIIYEQLKFLLKRYFAVYGGEEVEADHDKVVQDYKNGMSLEEIQKKYGISISNAYSIIHYGEEVKFEEDSKEREQKLEELEQCAEYYRNIRWLTQKQIEELFSGKFPKTDFLPAQKIVGFMNSTTRAKKVAH
jgi:transposase